uniref:Uncharacterized protein n=1 Tax=Ciona savignyi TaxID=51511 RepID=H2ZLV7_CIOSA
MMAIVLYYENKLIERTLLEILTKIKEENLRFEDLNMTRFTVVQYPLANVFLVVLITSVFSTTLCRRQNRLQASISYQTDVKKSS